MNDSDDEVREQPEPEAVESAAADDPEGKRSTASEDKRQFDVVPEQLERGLPEPFLRMLGLRVGEVSSSGAAAFGPNSTAISLNLPTRKRPFWLRDFDEQVLRDLAGWHVPTAADERLAELLKVQNLACLLGPPGTGRTSTAQVVLARRHGTGKVRLIEFAQSGSLKDLLADPEVWAGGHGYVLPVADGGFAWQDLTSLHLAVRRHGSSIVIVTGASGALSGTGSYRVDHTPPDPSEVFWRHLDRQSLALGGCGCRDDRPCGPRCRITLRQSCQDSEELAAALTGISDLEGAVDLAGRIAAVWPLDAQQLAAVLSGVPSRSLAVARTELAVPEDAGIVARHRHVQRQIHLIAYAMLVGCPLALVADAARELSAKTDPPRDEVAAELQVQGLGVHISQLIPARLRPEAAEVNGSPTEDVARFRHPGLVQAILEVAWKDYPAGHEALLDWLYRMIDDRRALVRQRAAVTAAVFAGFAPETVFTKLINLWANMYQARPRHAAAVACTVAAEDKRLRPLVIRYLHEWMNATGPKRTLFLDTVARAYIVGMGGQVPRDQAFQDLARVARDPLLVRSPSVALALTELARSGSTGRVVSTLSEWMHDDQHTLNSQAALAVPRLSDLTTETDGVVQPRLLAWAHDDTARTEELAALWQHSLLLPLTAFSAWKALGYWVGLADFDPAQADRITRLLATICRDEVFRPRLEFYLERVWPKSGESLRTRIMSIVKGQNNVVISNPA